MKPFAPACLVALLFLKTLTGTAGTINFETVFGQTPYEGMSISNQFQSQFGISFRRAPGANSEFPIIARVGWPEAAYDRNGTNESDTVSGLSVAIIGQFFLTDKVHDTGGDDHNLILDFDAPVSQVSGYVMDVDFDEHVEIYAYADRTGTNALESRSFQMGDPGVGGGIATYWNFARAKKDILRIEIAAHGAPVGYDVIATDYTPPPVTPATLGVALHPALTINGDVGRKYRIDYSDKLDRTLASTNWHTLTNLVLPTAQYLFFDGSPAASAERFYQAVGQP